MPIRIKVIPDGKIKIRLKELPALRNRKPEPFLGKYTAKIGVAGGAVYDGDKLIASHGQGYGLVVHEDYRRQGIGTELALRWRQRYTGYGRNTTVVLTESSKKIYDKVWAQVQRRPEDDLVGRVGPRKSPREKKQRLLRARGRNRGRAPI